MSRTPEERRRARPFLCRHNLWHRWESRRVSIFGRGLCQVWVCKRCHVGHPHMTAIRSFANGGIIPAGQGGIRLIGESPDCAVPLRRSERS